MTDEERTSLTVAPTTVAAAFDFAPTSLEGAMKLAEMLAGSTIVPAAYIGKPGNCFIAMQMGHEIGLQPVQSLQAIAVINGKPSIYGDAGKALLLRAGCRIEEADAEEIKKTGIARCTITVPGRAPVSRTFSVQDATAAGLIGKEGPWKQYRERQLAWRAFWFAARDGAADILKGLYGAEEVRDIVDVQGEVVSKTVQQPTAKPAPAPAPEAAAAAPPAVEQPASKPNGDGPTSPLAKPSMVNLIERKIAASIPEGSDLAAFRTSVLNSVGISGTLEGVLTVEQGNKILAQL